MSVRLVQWRRIKAGKNSLLAATGVHVGDVKCQSVGLGWGAEIERAVKYALPRRPQPAERTTAQHAFVDSEATAMAISTCEFRTYIITFFPLF